MKRIFAGALLSLLCASAVFAQEKIIAVSGRLVESGSKEPVVQATVQLLSLPDSAYAAGIASNNQGYFTLPRVKAGKYVLKISYIGYQTKLMALQLSASEREKQVGIISVDPDAVLLKEAVVTAEAPQVTMREDTVEFNSTAFRTHEGAMLEELVKKLPGAEIDSEGNVTINGKEIKKIMVEGKEFFGGDVKTGLKNLPANMIEKLKTYDKKSDLARITGIDDGEEETVLDLKVKKGMNQGWFGNADVAVGTERRYSSNLMLNRFVDHSQFSLIASANNVNDQGFSGGGGGPRFRNNNGLTAKKTIGVNFATETEKLDMGGSARYNYSDRDAVSRSYSERFLQQRNAYSNSNGSNRNKSNDFNAEFRIEWKPDTLTNLIFHPEFSYGDTNNGSLSQSGSFNEDPFNYVPDPNAYLDLDHLAGIVDPLKDIRVNASNQRSLSEGKNLSANATLQFNRRLSSNGRNITFRARGGYGDTENESYLASLTHYYQLKSMVDVGQDSLLFRRQYIHTPTQNHNYSLQLTYSEPIARGTFLQFSYQFQYRNNWSDRRTYDLNRFNTWIPGDPLPIGIESNYVDSLSKKATYRYYNHETMAGLRFVRSNTQLNVGLSLQPQNSRLDYKMGAVDTVVKRSVVNFSPNVELRIRFSNTSQLRFTYRGRASQPSMENLIPNPDNSNPLNIRMGNPGLKPSFTHQIRGFYNTYQPEQQRGFMSHINFSVLQNSISSVTRYNYENGGLITRPENVNGNWNAFAMVGFNTALKDKRFTINSFSRGNYNHTVSYLYSELTKDNDRNRSTQLTLAENLSGSFRNDWFEFSLNGSLEYTSERNRLRPTNNQQPYTYGYGCSTNITLPWNMSLSTNIMNNVRRGYRDASMNRNEVVWNAQIAQSFLKGNAATVTFELYDILRQQTNISRSLTADLRSVSEYNGITSYGMIRFTYQLNLFGSKEARSKMQERNPWSRGGFRPGGERRSGNPHRF